MHIPDVGQILLVLARDAYRVLPLVYELEDLVHRWWWERWRSLWKPADELVEKVLCRDLEVHGVSAVLDEGVKELRGREGVEYE